ncbi:unnamed protein product, partial [Prunus brigantina]
MISLSHSYLDLCGWISLNLSVAGKNSNFLPLFLTGWKLESCSFLIMIWDFKLMALRLHIFQTKSTGFLKEDARRWSIRFILEEILQTSQPTEHETSLQSMVFKLAAIHPSQHLER